MHCCAHRQEVKIVLYSIWCHHTCRWPSGAQVESGLCKKMFGKRNEFFFSKVTCVKELLKKKEELRKLLPAFMCKMFVSKLFTKPFYTRAQQNYICYLFCLCVQQRENITQLSIPTHAQQLVLWTTRRPQH